MATVIVPAHNEASVIKDCLDSIVTQQGIDYIIVPCNGCTDDTVDIVKNNFPQYACCMAVFIVLLWLCTCSM